MYKYPYGDSQQLNLDWILAKLKELEDAGLGLDLEKVSNALISLAYNTSTAYRRYDYCFLNGKLYRCLSDTSGVFDPSAWQEALIGDDLAVLTRWINAIDAAAVVDVKFDTSGTNGKIQQKYHDEYHDVVEVDYTPVQNSKRPLSSNAGYELNGAINNLTASDIANASQVTGSDVGDALNTLNGAINQEVAIRETYVRPNLLDNWYFVGGGSQQGGGQFPINQRGQTNYSNAGYSIDRWKLNDASSEISISSNGMIAHSGSTILQPLPADNLIGKKVTATILFENGVAITGTGTLIASGTTNFVSSQGVYLFAWGDTGAGTLSIAINVISSSNVTIVAVKLEIGDTQTLAHYDSTAQKWVLNEIPNYQQELAKCQRYQIALNLGGGNYQLVGNGIIWSATEADAFIPTPVTMRAQPTAEDVANWKLWTPNQIAVTSVTFNRVSGGLKAIFAITDGTAGNPFVVGNGATDSKLIVSCNL